MLHRAVLAVRMQAEQQDVQIPTVHPCTCYEQPVFRVRVVPILRPLSSSSEAPYNKLRDFFVILYVKLFSLSYFSSLHTWRNESCILEILNRPESKFLDPTRLFLTRKSILCIRRSSRRCLRLLWYSGLCRLGCGVWHVLSMSSFCCPSSPFPLVDLFPTSFISQREMLIPVIPSQRA